MWFWAAGPTEDANEFRKLSPFPCLTCNSSSPAPNQHHSSGSCPGELGNSGPHPLSLVLSHIHLQNRVPRGECVPVARKLRADRSGAETKSFCPCQFTCPQALRKPHGLGLFRPYATLDTVYQFPAHVASGAVLSHPPATGFYRRFPLQHPKRTRFRPFWGWTGCGPLFLPFFDPQNFWAGFCSLCRYVSQIEALGDAM